MQTVVAVITGLVGAVAMVVGLIWAMLWIGARYGFERVLKSQYVDQTKAQVADLLAGVRNPLVRRVLTRQAGEAAGAMLVSLIRGEMTSRVRVGYLIIAAGIGLVIAAFYVPSWWPALIAALSR